MSAKVLVIACGNPSRGDDALGPELAAALSRRCAEQIDRGTLEVLTDFQLQVEHALDLQGRRKVYFVDACVSGPAVSLTVVKPERDLSFSTHALSPAAVLHAYAQLRIGDGPECVSLAIRGERFELGEPITAEAQEHLELALRVFEESLAQLGAAPAAFDSP